MDLHFYWSYDYGNCLQFNSGFNSKNQKIELVNVTRKGKDFGLLIGIIPLINLNSLITTSSIGGIVFVHDNKFEPTEGVFLETGKKTFISVKTTIMRFSIYV